jgi:hypothetical protein
MDFFWLTVSFSQV